jgi:hypothetical protein
MSFSAEGYQLAALERLDSAEKLYDGHDYVMCHYAAGLAVECILRAYRYRRDPEFDSRHDLYLLYRASGVDAVIPDKKRYAVNASLAIVYSLWSNDHRFRSKADLRRFLRRRGLHRGIKGDFVKESARRIRIEADYLVTLWSQLWKR